MRISAILKEEEKKFFKQEGYDLTADQVSILIVLWEADGITQIELSNKLSKSKSSVTRTLDLMDKKGVITRKNDMNDRRVFRIFLTEYAKEVKDPIFALKKRRILSLYDEVSDNELVLLSEILDKIFTKDGVK